MSNIYFVSYFDDTKPYIFVDSGTQEIVSLKNSSQELFYLFGSNQMKASYDKCHLTTSYSGVPQISV